MTITRRADYAVRLMYELAQLPDGLTLSIRDLCEASDVPASFGTPLVEFLIEARLVTASGHRDHLLSLAHPASEITMAEIVRVCDPDFSLAPCTLDPASCDRSARCGVHRMWTHLDGIVWGELDRVTLAQVAAGGYVPTDITAPSVDTSSVMRTSPPFR